MNRASVCAAFVLRHNKLNNDSEHVNKTSGGKTNGDISHVPNLKDKDECFIKQAPEKKRPLVLKRFPGERINSALHTSHKSQDKNLFFLLFQLFRMSSFWPTCILFSSAILQLDVPPARGSALFTPTFCISASFSHFVPSLKTGF